MVTTHDGGGSSGHHAVQDQGGDEAGVLGAGVRLHQVGIVTEEALDVDAEQVGALHVVGQQGGARHDDQLEEEHVEGGGRRGERVTQLCVCRL